MSPRRYEQRLRAESADDTRRRILAAVETRLREAPTEPLALDQVATAARVARSTIYTVFGSRAGLLDAFAEDLWTRSGVAELTAAVQTTDAREHLRGGIDAASRMFAAERDVYRALFSMAQLDPAAVGQAVRRMNDERAGGMAHLVARLRADDVLRDDVSDTEAERVLWMVTSFESFDTLYTGRELPISEVIELLVRVAERSLLRPLPG